MTSGRRVWSRDMMALIFALAASASFLCVSSQGVGSNGGVVSSNGNYKHLDGCSLPNTDELMPFNATRSMPDLCILISCRLDRNIEYKHCMSEFVPQNCTLTDYNMTLSYPECCPVMICENSTTLNESDEIKTNLTTIQDQFEATTNKVISVNHTDYSKKNHSQAIQPVGVKVKLYTIQNGTVEQP